MVFLKTYLSDRCRSIRTNGFAITHSFFMGIKREDPVATTNLILTLGVDLSNDLHRRPDSRKLGSDASHFECVMSDLTKYMPSQFIPKRSAPITSAKIHSAPYRWSEKYRGAYRMLIWLSACFGMWAILGLIAYSVFRMLAS
jgi:hypothetical protein